MVKRGFKRGKYSPCLYYNPAINPIRMVHGDDFVSVGSTEAARAFRDQLESRFEIKTQVLGAEGWYCVLARILLTERSRWVKKVECSTGLSDGHPTAGR